MDRFQAVCYPMNNHFWQPTRSKLKIVIAWILACIMCIPQAILFVETDTDHGTKTCTAQIGNNTSTGGRYLYYFLVLMCTTDVGTYMHYVFIIHLVILMLSVDHCTDHPKSTWCMILLAPTDIKY